MVGEAGVEGPEPPSVPSRRRFFLMASAWRFGGPRRRLGRSKVHGISRAAQALHGGPDSSHWVSSLVTCGFAGRERVEGRISSTHLDFPYTTRIARLPQSIWSLLLSLLLQMRQRLELMRQFLRRRRWWCADAYMIARVAQRVRRLMRLLLEDIAQVLYLGVQALGAVWELGWWLLLRLRRGRLVRVWRIVPRRERLVGLRGRRILRRHWRRGAAELPQALCAGR